MNARLLLAEARAAGVDLVADGDRLRCRAPKGALTPELTAHLRKMKPALLQLLAIEMASSPLSLADVARFEALEVEVRLAGGALGELWLVPQFTDSGRLEISASDLRAIQVALTVWPGAWIRSIERRAQGPSVRRRPTDRTQEGPA